LKLAGQLTPEVKRMSRDYLAWPAAAFVTIATVAGLLRPIVLQPMCTGCHGPTDRISSDVKQILAHRYPQEWATGFAPGEIRGWYWVEMPKLR
jgi:Protein of unknown function (DUF3365)